MYVHDLGPRSSNDLNLQYSHTFIYSIRSLLLPTFRSLAAIVSEKNPLFSLFMPPTLKKWGGILVSACPYICMYVCMYVCIHVRDIVLKLHVWIPHGKIADAYFWFSLNYLPLSNYGPLTNKGMKFCKCRISKGIIARNLKLVSADRG